MLWVRAPSSAPKQYKTYDSVVKVPPHSLLHIEQWMRLYPIQECSA